MYFFIQDYCRKNVPSVSMGRKTDFNSTNAMLP